MEATLRRALTGSADAPILTFRRRYAATVEEVRSACTERDRLARWYGTIDPLPRQVGDAFVVELGGDDDRADAVLLRCEPHEIAISWSWQGEPMSTVVARIEAVDDLHTDLVIQHALAEPRNAIGYGGGWEEVLQELAQTFGEPEADGVEERAVPTWRALHEHTTVVEQHVPAPVDAVWTAWTTQRGLSAWWRRHWPDVEIDIALQVGGNVRLAAPSESTLVACELLVVDAAEHHLAATWTWSDAAGASVDEAVDVRLEPAGDGTLVTVRHTSPPADTAAPASQRQFWGAVLRELAGLDWPRRHA